MTNKDNIALNKVLHKDGPLWEVIFWDENYQLVLDAKNKTIADPETKHLDVKIKRQTMTGKPLFVLKVRKNKELLFKEQKEAEDFLKQNKKSSKQNKNSRFQNKK